MAAALLILAMLPSDAVTASMSAPAKPCDLPRMERIDKRHAVRVGKLGDMPPGKQLLAIYNEVDGCPTPIVVRDSVGMPERPTRR